MQILTPTEYSAIEAQNKTAVQVKRYSKLKIIRALGDDWETYKAQLEEAGYLDQFWAAEYMASDDPVFQAVYAILPDEVKAKLEECLWEDETGTIGAKAVLTTVTLFCLFFLTGCFSSTSNTVREYDGNGNLLRETVSGESIIKTLTDSTKNKTVIFWDNSFLAYADVSMVSADSPTPALKIGIGKADRGMISLLDKHDCSAAGNIIQAARAGDLSISASGVSASGVSASGVSASGQNKE